MRTFAPSLPAELGLELRDVRVGLARRLGAARRPPPLRRRGSSSCSACADSSSSRTVQPDCGGWRASSERARGLEREQRARVAHLEPVRLEQRLDRHRQLEQAQQVRHRGARAADRFGGLLVREVEFVDQALERTGLLERD
jgi:hypothetical protein